MANKSGKKNESGSEKKGKGFLRKDNNGPASASEHNAKKTKANTCENAKNDGENSKRFPNFEALTGEERLAFFKALAGARKNVEKAGTQAKDRFGTIHDEYLQYLDDSRLAAGDDKEPTVSVASFMTEATYTVSGSLEDFPENNSRQSGFSLPDNLSAYDLSLLDNSIELSSSSSSFGRLLGDGEGSSFGDGKSEKTVSAIAYTEFQNILAKDASDLVDLFLKKKKVHREAEKSNEKPSVEQSSSKAQPAVNKENVKPKELKMAPVWELSKRIKDTPRFDALDSEEKDIFFNILKEARDNVLERNPNRKNDIMTIEYILNRYQETRNEKAEDQKRRSDEDRENRNRNLNVKLTLTSKDNERLKEEAKAKLRAEAREEAKAKLRAEAREEAKAKLRAEAREKAKAKLKEKAREEAKALREKDEKQKPEVEIQEPEEKKKRETATLAEEKDNSNKEEEDGFCEDDINEAFQTVDESREKLSKVETAEKSKSTATQAIENPEEPVKPILKEKQPEASDKKEEKPKHATIESEPKVNEKPEVKEEQVQESEKAVKKEPETWEEVKDLSRKPSRIEIENSHSKTPEVDQKQRKDSHHSLQPIDSLVLKNSETAAIKSHEEVKKSEDKKQKKNVAYDVDKKIRSYHVVAAEEKPTEEEPKVSKDVGEEVLKDPEEEGLATVVAGIDVTKSFLGTRSESAGEPFTAANRDPRSSKEEAMRVHSQPDLRPRERISSIVGHVAIEEPRQQPTMPTMAAGKVVVMDDSVIAKIQELIQELEARARGRQNGNEYIQVILDYIDYLSRVLQSLHTVRKEVVAHARPEGDAKEVFLKFRDEKKSPGSHPSELNVEERREPPKPERSGSRGVVEEEVKESTAKKPGEDGVILDSGSRTSSISTLSDKDNEENLLAPMFTKQKRLPTTKIRLLQDLLKERAVIVEGSMGEFKIVEVPHTEQPKEAAVTRLHLEETEEKAKEMGTTSKFIRFLVRFCRCGKKETKSGSDNNILENLKGEAVPVDVGQNMARDAVSVTLNDSTMNVLKAAERKKIIEKYWKTT